VIQAAAVRVVAAISGSFLLLIQIAAALWIGSLVLFALWYWRMLLMPPVSRIALHTVQA
jgi:uncharacterized protein involved in response to NO